MRETIACGECSSCGYRYGFGFNGATTFYCFDRGREVDPKIDGCTFGDRGKPRPYSSAPEVYVGGDHAAHGF